MLNHDARSSVAGTPVPGFLSVQYPSVNAASGVGRVVEAVGSSIRYIFLLLFCGNRFVYGAWAQPLSDSRADPATRAGVFAACLLCLALRDFFAHANNSSVIGGVVRQALRCLRPALALCLYSFNYGFQLVERERCCHMRSAAATVVQNFHHGIGMLVVAFIRHF